MKAMIIESSQRSAGVCQRSIFKHRLQLFYCLPTPWGNLQHSTPLQAAALIQGKGLIRETAYG
jgi:hypothetical protein